MAQKSLTNFEEEQVCWSYDQTKKVNKPPRMRGGSNDSRLEINAKKEPEFK